MKRLKNGSGDISNSFGFCKFNSLWHIHSQNKKNWHFGSWFMSVFKYQLVVIWWDNLDDVRKLKQNLVTIREMDIKNNKNVSLVAL